MSNYPDKIRRRDHRGSVLELLLLIAAVWGLIAATVVLVIDAVAL